MTIDIERLEADLDYWNEVAPEGADAVLVRLGNVVDWYCTETREVYFQELGEWEPSRYFEQRADDLIPRPTPAASNHSQAWNGEGLPPVGVECELALDGSNRGAVTITYMGDGVFCYRDSNEVEATGALYCAEFRPLKTEKERVVDAVMEVAGFGENMRHGLNKAFEANALRMPKGEK